MSTDRRTAKDVFVELVSNVPPEQWENWLEESCRGDDELRDHVRALLRAHAEPGSFLERPAMAAIATILHEPPISEGPGTIIGPYKLLEQIGEGGMGVVFMAEQDRPIHRTVALKIIKPGMDTRQVIARFEAERQALALMDHPNIARVIDAGATEAGRPYFVMELVKGVPITGYCDRERLSVRQRLELMNQVCRAVQHAHQKGIIHRDLKPSNVLVAEYDARPVPKVIDFGVAKAAAQKLTEKTMFTEYGQLIGTFEYMSPEQARFNQLDIDTRSDVYSLGVLLYELLVGSTPLEKDRLRSAAFDEILRIIGEEDPPKPSLRLSASQSLPSIAANRSLEPKRLTGLVNGELDAIVMKCLEKERANRYGSTDQVIDELQRFLGGEPVHARPTTASQRLYRWYNRHLALVAGAYTVFTFLIFAIEYLALFSVIQFAIARPTPGELLASIALTAATTLMCLLGAETGVAAIRGKPRGLWTSLIAFAVFGLAQCWWLYWSVVISRDISATSILSFSALNPATLEGRNAFIRNGLIGLNALGVTWASIGLALHAHALCRRDADQRLTAQGGR